jgi:restriction system protein
MPVPTYDELFNPLLQAMRELGGSASIPEQELKVAQLLNLTVEDVAEIHRGTTTKLSYRLTWARHYLKRFGLLQNSARGVWVIAPTGSEMTTVDPENVKRQVGALGREERKKIEITGNLFEGHKSDSR